MLKVLSFTSPLRGKVFHSICDHTRHSNVASVLQLYPLGDRKVYAHNLSSKADLPALPVPPLRKTMDLFLKSVKPHVTEREYKNTEELAKMFIARDGCGQKLQHIIENKARKNKNWLADWWLNTAYMGFRWPVVVWSSPGLVFPLQTVNCEDEQLTLAAKVIIGALDYKKLIDEDKIPPETMGKAPLDMGQYKKILGTCRIPGVPLDSLIYANPVNPPKHIIVMHQNKFFKLNVLTDIPLSIDDIKFQLKAVVKDCSEDIPEPVGILTSEHRDTWAKAYKDLIKDPQNVATLKTIQESLFLVCLDGPNAELGAPNQQTQAALQMVHGCGSQSNGGNRWFDKTVQFVVGNEGNLGLTYEHSPAEGPPIANLMDHVMKFVDQCPDIPSTGNAELPERLVFSLPDEIIPVIGTAKKNLDSMVCDLDMYGFTYKGYGREFPKSHRMSPDSFIQMAIQLAFYRLHGKPGAHYESASTRMYDGGRTETIRSCSCESIAFAQTMLDKKKSDAEKIEALKMAVECHKQYVMQAIQGFGVDRHLLGLKLAAAELNYEVPTIFNDPGYIRSSHMRISTSQVAAKSEAFMCYGPLVCDGYGCCYNPRKNEIIIGVSAFHSCKETSAAEFAKALIQSFDDMHNMLVKNTPSKL